MIYNYFGCEANDFANITSRFKRINKTHQLMQGIFTLKQEFNDDLSIEVDILRQDQGGWHPLVKRYLENACSVNFEKTGLGYGLKTMYYPMIPDGCPIKPNTWNLTRVMPRYRQEWTPEFQSIVPPLVPTADKWRIQIKFFNKNKERVAVVLFEHRLINRFSSQ